MKTLALLLALGLTSAFGFVDRIPAAYKANPIALQDPVQVPLFNGSFETSTEVTYSPVFELTNLAVYRGFDSAGFLREDSTMGNVKYMAYDLVDQESVTDSVSIQCTFLVSDYSACGNPDKCPELSDPWYVAFQDTLAAVSAGSAKVEKFRVLHGSFFKTTRFAKVRATGLSASSQNLSRIIGEWHRKKRVQ